MTNNTYPNPFLSYKILVFEDLELKGPWDRVYTGQETFFVAYQAHGTDCCVNARVASPDGREVEQTYPIARDHLVRVEGNTASIPIRLPDLEDTPWIPPTQS